MGGVGVLGGEGYSKGVPAMTNEYGAKAIHYWQYARNPTNFDSMLLTLLQKADSTNRMKIASQWPEIYQGWKEWNECESQDAYFERYGLPLHGRDYT